MLKTETGTKQIQKYERKGLKKKKKDFKFISHGEFLVKKEINYESENIIYYCCETGTNLCSLISKADI